MGVWGNGNGGYILGMGRGGGEMGVGRRLRKGENYFFFCESKYKLKLFLFKVL